MRRLALVLVSALVAGWVGVAAASGKDVFPKPDHAVVIDQTPLFVADFDGGLLMGVHGAHDYIVPDTVLTYMNGSGAMAFTFTLNLGPGLSANSIHWRSLFETPHFDAPDFGGKFASFVADASNQALVTAAKATAGKDREIVPLPHGMELLAPDNEPTKNVADWSVSNLLFGAGNKIRPLSTAIMLSQGDTRFFSITKLGQAASTPIFTAPEPRLPSLGKYDSVIMSRANVLALDRELDNTESARAKRDRDLLRALQADERNQADLMNDLKYDDYPAARDAAKTLAADATALQSSSSHVPTSERTRLKPLEAAISQEIQALKSF